MSADHKGKVILYQDIFVTAYQSGVNDMVHGGEPLPDPETDPPQRDDIREKSVPHNVPAHHSTPFILNN